MCGSWYSERRIEITLPPFVPHVREQEHVADGFRIGEQHDQTVDADAHAARRRHAVLERAHVVGVVADLLLFFTSTVILLLPASMEFSTNSFIIDSGLSTTSPAAILSAIFFSSTLII